MQLSILKSFISYSLEDLIVSLFNTTKILSFEKESSIEALQTVFPFFSYACTLDFILVNKLALKNNNNKINLFILLILINLE